MKKQLKLIVLSASAVLLLAACGEEMTDPPPVDPETEEAVPELPNEEDSAGGIEGQVEPTEPAGEDSQDNTNGENEVQGEEVSQSETETSEEPASDETLGIENTEFEISLDDAIQIFRDETSQDVHFEEIEFEEDDGRYEYEIEGYLDGTEYEMEIQADTGDILDFDQEQEDDEDTPLDLEGIISPQEAMQTALSDLEDAYVWEWELEVDRGRTVYEIDLVNGRDVDVDAHTGELF